MLQWLLKYGIFALAPIFSIGIVVVGNLLKNQYLKSVPMLRWQWMRQMEIMDYMVELNGGWGDKGRPANRPTIKAGPDPFRLGK